MTNQSLTEIISTLVTHGFNIQKVERFSQGTNIITTYKFDKLGGKVEYSILFTNDLEEKAIVDTLMNKSARNRATPIIVCDHFDSSKCKTYTLSDFFGLFGGLTNTGLILIPNISEILNDLGHNRLYPGLSGSADSLHELYIKECLQFITQSPTRRYGIERSFESLPDAVVICRGGFMLLVDSKSYLKGFSFHADDIKRFKNYVEDFRERYSIFFGSILSFLVVSGHFNDSAKSLTKRSDELYKACGCKLSCITSVELGKIVILLNTNEKYRNSIVWKNIFIELMIDINHVELEIKRINKDNLH